MRASDGEAGVGTTGGRGGGILKALFFLLSFGCERCLVIVSYGALSPSGGRETSCKRLGLNAACCS